MLPNSKTNDKRKVVGIPAKTLTQKGLAVCFFPEQPERKIIAVPIEEEFEEKKLKKVEASVQKDKVPEPSIERTQKNDNRLRWKNRLYYTVASAAFSISLNNVVFFPLQLYRFGASFLIPYTVFSITIGYPIHALQVSLGQYRQRGIINAWYSVPLFRGVGVSMFISCIVVSSYYNLFAAYALIYFSRCFNQILPWTYCSEIFLKSVCSPRECSTINSTHPAEYYFYNNILNTPQEHSFGSIKWWLVVSLIFAWIIVYVATMRSVRSIEKVSLFFLIFIYSAYLMLLIVVLQIKHVKVEFNLGSRFFTIYSFEVWAAAAIQVLLELGICHGIPLTYGSYCHIKNHMFTDSIYICFLNYLHSILFWLLFSLLFTFQLCPINNVFPEMVLNELGIVYIFFSEKISNIRGSNLWCVIFFLMLFCVVVSTQIGITEAVMLNFYEHFSELTRFRWIMNLIFCVFFLMINLLFCFGNGFFSFNLLHTLSIFFTILPIVILFLIGSLYCHGLQKYFRDMINSSSYAILKSYLHVIIVFLVLLFVLSIASIKLLLLIIMSNSHSFTEIVIACVFLIFIIIPAISCLVIKGFIFVIKNNRNNNGKESEEWIAYKENFDNEEYSSAYFWKWRKIENEKIVMLDSDAE